MRQLKTAFYDERGVSLAAAVMFVLLTVIFAIGFLNMPVYNAQAVEVLIDETQIYWANEAGMAIGITHLKHNTNIADNTYISSPNKVLTIDGEYIITVPPIKIDRAKKAGVSTFTNAYVFKITVGSDNMDVLGNKVSRHHQQIVEKTSYALYAYLSDIETAPDGTIIRFWTPDKIEGLTHSNDVIHMMQSPTFEGTVSTAASMIDDWNASPIYLGVPPKVVNADSIIFPEQAEDLRDAATRQGNFKDLNNIGYNVGWLFIGGGHPQNTEDPDYLANRADLYARGYDDHGNLVWEPRGHCTIQDERDNACFVDVDTLLVQGGLRGRMSIGCSGDMYLMDDVYYDEAHSFSRYDVVTPGKPREDCPDYMGLISEGDIFMADFFWQGRIEYKPGYIPGYPNRRDIVIAAGIVALNESFTVHCGTLPGERGDIHMWGALAQKRRGVVHTIDRCPNPQNIYTGYGKDYHYDDRFQNWPPPYYLNTNSGKGGSVRHSLWTGTRDLTGDYQF